MATALACALLLLILPATASALTYTVDSIGDEADEPAVGCETSATTCTLRAAIEESNNSETVDDTILFDNVLFNGQQEDTIVQGANFPEVKDTVEIDADAGGATNGRCTTESTFVGPCAGIKGQGLVVAAPAVKIEGLSVIEAAIGIRVEGSGFVAEDNWIGVKLNGISGANTTGVLVLGVDGPQIGGKLPAMRNVFGWSTTGLVLRGTTEAKVQGNYFGSGPNGASPAPQLRNLVIADSASNGGIASEDTLVGADVGTAGIETPACDLGCNVFINNNGPAPSIDLRKNAAFEEEPSTGPTTLQGNYVGLTATGTEPAGGPNTAVINVGSASNVTIGGPDSGDANQIHGGTHGILAGDSGEPAKNLVVENNSIGRALDGSGSFVPPGVGVFISSEGMTATADRAQVLGNRITAVGNGIELHSFGALAEGNTVSGGSVGIIALGLSALTGNAIENNTVSDSGEEGILVRTDNNEVVGNTVTGAGKAGIRVQSFSFGFGFPIVSGNLIGGNGAAAENVISESAGDAIEVSDVEESQNEIGRNRGSGNAGSFIDLVASELGEKGPNDGIVPPAFATALQSSATGTSLPNATVRIFRKANGSAGELDSFIAEADADGSGNWKVTYPAQLPTGTLVAATQTSTLNGTSELSTATSQADPVPPACPDVPAMCVKPPTPPDPPKKPVCLRSGGCNPAGVPDTKIDKGPKKKSTKTTAKFKFHATSQATGFECRLDKKRFAKCASPKTYKKLKPGKHTFEARAFSAGGKDSTPAKYKFTVLG
ncbi:MAG TPA: right-handed parallel beta-helix repeat-containing protein [Solirubrobacterales bacterium]|nr:right-handed parallel beta-helix repeat-containing protein [Solirubrobacterales bacterium]